MHLGIKIALGGLLAGRKSGPDVLANMSVPSISTAVIGGSSVLSFGTWQGAASLAGELLRDGVVVATGLTDGQAMTWLAGDDLANMELRVTATGADGMQLLQVSAPFVVRYAPPTAAGTLFDEIFDTDTGPQLIDASVDFTGSGLSYSVSGSGVTIDTQTGMVTVSTDMEISSSDITVIAQNSGGSVSSTFMLTVEGATGSTALLYNNSFGADGAADYAEIPGTLIHDLPNTRMQFGGGANGETAILRMACTDGGQHQIFFNITNTNAGEGRTKVIVEVRSSTLGVLWSSGDIEQGFKSVQIPPISGSAYVDLKMVINSNGTNRRLNLEESALWDISESGPVPTKLRNSKAWWIEEGYDGEAMPSVDLAGLFDGTVDGYIATSTNGQSVAFAGSVATVTGGSTPGTDEVQISALNGTVPSIGTVDLDIDNLGTASTFQLSTTKTAQDQTLEVDWGMYPLRLARYLEGGVYPYTYSVVSKPAWMTLDGGLLWGTAPSSAAATQTVTIRATDVAGSTVDVSFDVTVIAARSRAGSTLADGSSLRTAIAAASAGDVIVLNPAFSYDMSGSGFSSFPQDNPVYVVGAGATVSGVSDWGNQDGVVFENITFVKLTQPATDSTAVVGFSTSDYLRFHDCTFTGYTETLPQPLASKWLNADPVTYWGRGLVFGGQRCVAQNCTFAKCYEGFAAEYAEHGFYSCTTDDFRDDGFILTKCGGVIVHDHKVGAFGGNYTAQDHRDIFQFFANNGRLADVVIDTFFGTSDGTPDVQGVNWDHDNWSSTTKKRTDAYENMIFRDVFMLASNYNGISFERVADGAMERVVMLPFPGSPKSPGFVHRRPSNMDISNCIYEKLAGDAHDGSFGDWAHLITLSNNEDIQTTGTAYTDIFPNWNNTGLAYEDPRDAVANGAAASAARFWIDPVGAWSLAHPDIGPMWLRTG